MYPQQQEQSNQQQQQTQSQTVVQPTAVATYNNVQTTPHLQHRSLPKDGEINRFRRRKWVWMMAVIDAVLAIMVVGRFFHYVANDARISNTPPESELEDRISLLWTWFAFLAAYVCQFLMSVALILSTQKNDTETVLGNCQLYIYGCHVLNLYTFVEFVIIIYNWFKSGQGPLMWIIVALAAAKIMFRSAMFLSVKFFMSDLARPSCTCTNHSSAVTHDMDGNLLPRQSWSR